jgi:hypothetical protein
MDVFDLERKFPEVAKIRFNGMPAWPLLRVTIGYELARREFKARDFVQSPQPSTLSNFLKSTYGWARLIIHRKKFTHLIFSNNLEKRVYKQRYYDRLFHSTVTLLGEQNVLVINYCEGNITPIKNSYYRNIVNGDIINYLSIIFSRFVKLSISTEDKALINVVLQAAQIESDYIGYLKRFIAASNIYRKLFHLVGPEVVLTGCYTYFSQIYAAKSNAISTVEYQHGMINDKHRGYKTLVQYDGIFTADRLFAFGSKSIFNLDESIYKKTQICLVGYSYFELLSTGFFDPLKISKSGHDQVVCVPVDEIVENETVSLIVSVAPLVKNVLFLINPRTRLSNSSLNAVKQLTNVKYTLTSFQLLVQQCDYTLTIFSTCAFESVYFGVPNLLYNYKGYAKKTFRNILDERSSYYFDREDELVGFFRSPVHFDLTAVKTEGSKFYVDNHYSRIKEELYAKPN